MLSANSRREEIYHLAATTGLASMEELSPRFEVTVSTIRRDPALLNGQGWLARTYGGAMALGAHSEASLRQRTGKAFEQKPAIARWAAGVIRPGENTLHDADSTAGALWSRPDIYLGMAGVQRDASSCSQGHRYKKL